MMPNTSVRPAASRNSRSPNCRPLRNCSTRNIGIGARKSVCGNQDIRNPGSALRNGVTPPLVARAPISASLSLPLHRAPIVEPVLAVLQDGGDGLQAVGAVGILHRLLQIEVLDREMVVPVLV